MSRSLKMPDKLTRAVVYAHCPQCGCSRRAFAADEEARELYVKCPCDVDPLFSEPCVHTVSGCTEAVGTKGGLTRSSVPTYANRVVLWRQASHLRDVLLELGAVAPRFGPTLKGVLANDSPTVSEVLSTMPQTALHPGVEEWVALAQRVVIDALACGRVTEEE